MRKNDLKPVSLTVALLSLCVAWGASAPARAGTLARADQGPEKGVPVPEKNPESETSGVAIRGPETPLAVALAISPASVDGLDFVALAGSEARVPEIPNFHKVDEHLYRGGQPGVGGAAKLKALGVRTVINLRYEDAAIKAEEAEMRAAGMQYFNVPMYGLLRPKDEQVSRVLGLIEDPKNWPVFVHCVRGSDRTGAIVACYRVSNTKWTAEKAIREALDHGMYRVEYAKRRFIRAFYKKFIGSAATIATDGLAPSPHGLPASGAASAEPEATAALPTGTGS